MLGVGLVWGDEACVQNMIGKGSLGTTRRKWDDFEMNHKGQYTHRYKLFRVLTAISFSSHAVQS